MQRWNRKKNPTNTTRICAGKCGRTLHISEFYTRKRKNSTGLDEYCKQCRGELNRKWYDPEHNPKLLDYRKQQRAERINNIYNLTIEDVEQLKAFQNDECAICKRPLSKFANIDHSHKTGLIRGLLCMTCNKGLGYLKDNMELLLATLDYLKTPPAVLAFGGEKYANMEKPEIASESKT